MRMRTRARGFTLLEVMIAIMVLSTALTLLASSWGAASIRIRKAQLQFEAASILESKMAEVEIQYRGGSLDEIPEDPQENEIDETHKWRLSSKKMEFPDLTSAFTQGGAVNPMIQTLVQQFTDTLKRSIKEVTVTVIVSDSGKNYEYSATTYFIDYSKAGGMGAGFPGGAPAGGAGGPGGGG